MLEKLLYYPKWLKFIKDHKKSVNVISFGTLMFEVAKENGLER